MWSVLSVLFFLLLMVHFMFLIIPSLLSFELCGSKPKSLTSTTSHSLTLSW